MLLEQQASTQEAPAPAGNAALKVTGTRGLAHNPCQAPQGLCLSAHLTPHPLLVTTTYLLLCPLCNTRTARIRGEKRKGHYLPILKVFLIFRWSPHPCKCPKHVWMWHLGMWLVVTVVLLGDGGTG